MKAPANPQNPTVKRKGIIRILRGPWRVPTYADSTIGDRFEGEDIVVRHAAIDALAGMNGSVVVTHPDTGLVLTIVNQQLAFKDGFQPCSTVKVPVALAALSESVVERNTLIHLYGRTSIGLTEALAKSNNQYFATLGQKLGFERVSYYAKLFGLGEKAGYNIEGERVPSVLPRTTPHNGIGMMTSFGDGITVTAAGAGRVDRRGGQRGGSLLLPAVSADAGGSRVHRAAHEAAAGH